MVDEREAKTVPFQEHQVQVVRGGVPLLRLVHLLLEDGDDGLHSRAAHHEHMVGCNVMIRLRIE